MSKNYSKCIVQTSPDKAVQNACDDIMKYWKKLLEILDNKSYNPTLQDMLIYNYAVGALQQEGLVRFEAFKKK